MTRTETLRVDDSLLLLGRLDGRLHASTCGDIFLARSRLEGAAALAGLAGVPIAAQDLQDWIAGRRSPPRASEGLNDPISVAAIFHIALSRDEDLKNPIARATLNTLRQVLDDRTAAETYAASDLAHFGPLWRQVHSIADAPFPAGDLLSVASRVIELAALTEPATASSCMVTTVDGRALELQPRGRDRTWLIAVAMPRMLYRAGFTTQVIPSLILLPRYLPPSPADLVKTLELAIGRTSRAGLRELDTIERAAARIRSDLQVTRRSKAPLLARLQLSYPGLQPAAVARLLNITPQGARKLLASMTPPSRPVPI
ncbi:hypothetical protein [Sphingomonas sanxanigenens]|uniref:HTH DNA binding domain-containing protein n=1 Tax=Sphingomonas sanxanigenens DSM 19645 = NX02 TaxID=1123269 RepID=A0A0F7JW47_9SPHN|nr:hypothetical protein [Sphingomonas sanxanigenens]AKH18950.1 hypothetical protein NX02_p1545 [Sphingomonas sanxanigenens DSM 19645 = NX02]